MVSWQVYQGKRRLDIRICHREGADYWKWTKRGVMVPEDKAEEFAEAVAAVVRAGPPPAENAMGDEAGGEPIAERQEAE